MTTLFERSKNGSSSCNFNALSQPPHPHSTKSQLDSIDRAIDAYKRGEFVIVMDDEDRENEGDLVLPACGVTAEQMAWMIKWTRYVWMTNVSSHLHKIVVTSAYHYSHPAYKNYKSE